MPNLEFREADCAALPFADASFDAVVSFETIEHIAAQEAFLDEVRRVLRPDGLFILSCPNKTEYTDKRGVVNEFHVRELYRDELAALLAPRFAHARVVRAAAGLLFGGVAGAGRRATARSSRCARPPPTRRRRDTRGRCTSSSSRARAPRRSRRIAPRLSVLADRDEWVYRDYENVTRAVAAAQRERAARSAQPKPRSAAARCGSRSRERDARRGARRGERRAAERARLARRDRAAAAAKIARRASLRWWLALPLRRLWHALERQAALGVGCAAGRRPLSASSRITGWWSEACVSLVDADRLQRAARRSSLTKMKSQCSSGSPGSIFS